MSNTRPHAPQNELQSAPPIPTQSLLRAAPLLLLSFMRMMIMMTKQGNLMTVSPFFSVSAVHAALVGERWFFQAEPHTQKTLFVYIKTYDNCMYGY